MPLEASFYRIDIYMLQNNNVANVQAVSEVTLRLSSRSDHGISL